MYSFSGCASMKDTTKKVRALFVRSKIRRIGKLGKRNVKQVCNINSVGSDYNFDRKSEKKKEINAILCTNTNAHTHKLIIISEAVIVANLFFRIHFEALSDKGFSQTTNEICFQVMADDDGSSRSSSSSDGGAPAQNALPFNDYY